MIVFDWLTCLMWIILLNKVGRRDSLNRYCGRILQCHVRTGIFPINLSDVGRLPEVRGSLCFAE